MLIDPLHAAVDRRAASGWARVGDARAALDAIAIDPAVDERLALVARRFGLTPTESGLLSIAVAAEQSTAAHLLCGLLSGDDRPARPTVALALELVGAPALGHIARQLVGPGSTLTRTGLLTLRGDDVLLSRRVCLPDPVAQRLAGGDAPPEWLGPLLIDVPAVDVTGTSLLCSALSAGHQLVWIHSAPGGAGAAMAVAACEALEVGCVVADVSRLPPGASMSAAVSALLLHSGLQGAVLALVGAEQAAAELPLRPTVPILATSTQPWDPRWSPDPPVTVSAPRLHAADRGRIWRSMIDPESVTDDIVAMPLSPEQIVGAARHAAEMAGIAGEQTVDPARIRSSVRHLGRSRAVRANPEMVAGLDDLVLPEHAMAEIRRLLDWARCRDEVAGLGALYGKGARGAGICALFSGPSGTGKTLAAHVVASSLGMDLYQVDLSAIVDKYIGETEKNLERVFTEAESVNAVLFFDEADALFGARSAVKDAKDRYANTEIAYLLQRMEQFDGITVLASNLRGNIDPAFARRLHFIVAFPDPDAATRSRLWEHHLGSLPADPADPVDVQELAASIDMAGGDIRNIVLSACYAAVADGSPLGRRHITAAVHREYTKLGRRQPAAPTQLRQ